MDGKVLSRVNGDKSDKKKESEVAASASQDKASSTDGAMASGEWQGGLIA